MQTMQLSTQRSSVAKPWSLRRLPQRKVLATPRVLPPDANTKLEGVKVLVAGATGDTGKQVVELLQQLGVPVRALVRDVDKATRILRTGPGLDLVKGDVFQYSTLPKALGDADTIIIATGASDPRDPLGPFNVDFQGTANLVALAVRSKVKKVVLVTSIGTDDLLNPLNLFWGVLFWKKRAEEQLQRSGLDFTIVRPGGLKNKLREGEREGAVVMKPAGYYGVPPSNRTASAGSILRKQVAEVCVAALIEPESSNKVVEVIASPDAVTLTYEQLFQSVEY